MPLVRKRALSEVENGLGAPSGKRQKTGTKELFEFRNIGYCQDFFHSLHRFIPDNIDYLHQVLAKEIGSLLNGKGGILCFGCRTNGTVYGEQLPRKQEDKIKLVIDDIFKRFNPMVLPQRYRVVCSPVLTRQRYTGRMVVEIKVQHENDFEMYEDYNHETYLRTSDGPYGPLTPHEIKRHTTQQLREKFKALLPIQNALLSPPIPCDPKLPTSLQTTKTVTPPPLMRVNPKGPEKTKFSVKLKRRKESSGSEEDPIIVSVLKPVDPLKPVNTTIVKSVNTPKERDSKSATIESKQIKQEVIDLTISPMMAPVGKLGKDDELEEGEIVDDDDDRESSISPACAVPLQVKKEKSLPHPLARDVRSVPPSRTSQSAVVGPVKSTTTASQPQAKSITSSLKPVMSSSRPVTSSSKPVTSSSRTATSSSKPATSSLKPVTSSSKPATSSSKPATSSSKPMTSSLKPVTSLKSATASSRALPSSNAIVADSQSKKDVANVTDSTKLSSKIPRPVKDSKTPQNKQSSVLKSDTRPASKPPLPPTAAKIAKNVPVSTKATTKTSSAKSTTPTVSKPALSKTAQTISKPVQPIAKSDSKPVKPDSKSVQPVSKTVQPDSKAVQPNSKSVQPVSKAVKTVTKPVSKAVQPVSQPVSKPVSKAVQPPVSKPVQSVAKVIQLVSKPVEPVSKPAVHSVPQPSQPTQKLVSKPKTAPIAAIPPIVKIASSKQVSSTGLKSGQSVPNAGQPALKLGQPVSQSTSVPKPCKYTSLPPHPSQTNAKSHYSCYGQPTKPSLPPPPPMPSYYQLPPPPPPPTTYYNQYHSLQYAANYWPTQYPLPDQFYWK